MNNNIRYYDSRICQYCGKVFLVKSKLIKNRTPARVNDYNIRGKNCLTCSSECSKKRSRLYYKDKKYPLRKLREFNRFN